jgi:hypothetical protein
VPLWLLYEAGILAAEFSARHSRRVVESA